MGDGSSSSSSSASRTAGATFRCTRSTTSGRASCDGRAGVLAPMDGPGLFCLAWPLLPVRPRMGLAPGLAPAPVAVLLMVLPMGISPPGESSPKLAWAMGTAFSSAAPPCQLACSLLSCSTSLASRCELSRPAALASSFSARAFICGKRSSISQAMSMTCCSCTSCGSFSAGNQRSSGESMVVCLIVTCTSTSRISQLRRRAGVTEPRPASSGGSGSGSFSSPPGRLCSASSSAP
mmetsp:Transcript_29406/g.74799  ORF Transcript_29406/g.74799 Transcript_29406/m.74799 type:complete len:235 (-) Transcript_29406:133-837(-)